MYWVVMCKECGNPQVCKILPERLKRYVFTCHSCDKKTKLRDRLNNNQLSTFGSYETSEQARQKLIRITNEYRKKHIELGKGNI